MRTIPAGRFRQKCLRILDEVRETGEVVVITKRGLPVAQLCAVPRAKDCDWAGAMSGSGEILGDLVAPALEPGEWQGLRPSRRSEPGSRPPARRCGSPTRSGYPIRRGARPER